MIRHRKISSYAGPYSAPQYDENLGQSFIATWLGTTFIFGS